MNCSVVEKNNSTDIPRITLNGVPLPAEEIAREAQYHAAASPQQAIRKAAEALVIQRLLLEKARQLALEDSVEAAEDEVFEEALIRLLLESQAMAEEPQEADCRRYFDANRAKFHSPDLLEVSHILVAAPDQSRSHEAKQAAQALIAQLRESPRRFADLAAEHSICPSKETGGNLGQLTPGQTVPEFERQVFRLSEGLAKDPVESRYGYHVVKIDRKISGRPLEYHQVRDKIVSYLRESRQRLAISQYIRGLIEEAEIEGLDLKEALVQ